MAKDKLPVLKRLAEDVERVRGHELRQLREERRTQEAQAQALEDMLEDYRESHRETVSVQPEQLAIFQRFYSRVRDTLVSHGDHVETLRDAEQAGERAWQQAYRKNQAISRLQEKRIEEARRESLRKERRTGVFRRWSMLNTNEQERGD